MQHSQKRQEIEEIRRRSASFMRFEAEFFAVVRKFRWNRGRKSWAFVLRLSRRDLRHRPEPPADLPPTNSRCARSGGGVRSAAAFSSPIANPEAATHDRGELPSPLAPYIPRTSICVEPSSSPSLHGSRRVRVAHDRRGVPRSVKSVKSVIFYPHSQDLKPCSSQSGSLRTRARGGKGVWMEIDFH
jgi:hypothetical protein